MGLLPHGRGGGEAMKVIVIPVEGKVYEAEISNDLETLKHFIGGGWIEAVNCRDFTAIIDEEGKLKGMPYNPVATWACKDWIQQGDYIAGPWVLTGPVYSTGELTDVPDLRIYVR